MTATDDFIRELRATLDDASRRGLDLDNGLDPTTVKLMLDVVEKARVENDGNFCVAACGRFTFVEGEGDKPGHYENSGSENCSCGAVGLDSSLSALEAHLKERAK